MLYFLFSWFWMETGMSWMQQNQPNKTPPKPTNISEFKGTILHTVDEQEQHI